MTFYKLPMITNFTNVHKLHRPIDLIKAFSKLNEQPINLLIY